MSPKSSATLKSAPTLNASAPHGSEAAERADLRDQVALLRASADSRWREIAALTRMVERLEQEKIESRSAYDRERRRLEGEIAGLRRMLEKAGGKEKKPARVTHTVKVPMGDEGYWEEMYNAVIHSTSWKLTAPLRAVIDTLRRLTGRG